MPSHEEFAALTTPGDSFDARPAISYLVKLGRSRGASDMHLSPLDNTVELLLRTDGVLRREFELTPEVYERLLTGLKNMAKLVSYQRSTPQDGALQLEGVDVRVATAPTVRGERAVLRFFQESKGLRCLQELGYTPEEERTVLDLADQPQGLFLATGPAGSGKSTTLLSMMRRLVEIRRDRVKSDPAFRCSVVTLEDPVECLVSGFHQTSIKPQQGMTFAEGLRSLLRQDPELILVGEIRDRETAQAVVQAGLTGQLVFSTLHARDSVGVVPRMLELGVEPYQLAAALAGVVYQRLVRTLCSDCRSQDSGGQWSSAGCPACSGSGYQGRRAVPEILPVKDQFRELILRRAPLAEMRAWAVAHQTVPLWESAQRRVAAGLTSSSEVERVIPRLP